MVTLLITSFLAGILTVLTPCTLPLLPIVLGGSVNNKSKYRPLIIISCLALSIFIFTLLLKTGVNALTVDDTILRVFSGLIILLLGVFSIYPNLWGDFTRRIGLSGLSNSALVSSQKYGPLTSAVITGLALGPVFSSCSPTYGYILFAILPLNLAQGILCLVFFLLGMSIFLLLVSLVGQRLINKTKWAANPNGSLRKFIGILFVVVGVIVIFRIDKSIESFLLQQPVIQNLLLNKVEQDIINTL